MQKLAIVFRLSIFLMLAALVMYAVRHHDTLASMGWVVATLMFYSALCYRNACQHYRRCIKSKDNQTNYWREMFEKELVLRTGAPSNVRPA